MEKRMLKLYSKSGTVPLKVVKGHFATNHSHINYYIDITTLKTRLSEAESAAKELVNHYLSSAVVDTIVCLDGTEVIGTCLASELTHSGFMSLNSHRTIYVVTPEYNSNSQLLFRDNIQPMIEGKHVLILMASVTTGKTISKSIECVQYYGGAVEGLAAVYSNIKTAGGLPVHSVFTPDDLPDYASYDVHECPYCKAGQRIEALVNSFGYSKL
ncbi:phosphoribosyltransferase [Allofournierella sp.]|uniref:phosphoribosyltransferase n=1 Tax=Allofournierella sp. TaxID=1940256 RepID=UPI003AEF89CB